MEPYISRNGIENNRETKIENASLEAVGVSAGYGSAPVLHQVSLMLHGGEFVGLIGPNGCGKSTLLRVLTGILPRLSGEALLEGRDIKAWSARYGSAGSRRLTADDYAQSEYRNLTASSLPADLIF